MRKIHYLAELTLLIGNNDHKTKIARDNPSISETVPQQLDQKIAI